MVDIVVLKLHLSLVDRNISKHTKTSSALFDKCGAALRTADLNASLASGNADLLPARRALIDMVRPALDQQILLAVEGAAQLIGLIQIPLVLGGALIDVPGEHAEISQDDTSP